MTDIVARVRARLVKAKLLDPVKAMADATNRASAAMITQLRRTAQIGISMAQVFGGAIDQTLALGIEATLLTIEMITVTSAAISATALTPMLLFRAGAMTLAIISMLTTIVQLERGQTENANKTRGAVAAFRLISY